MRLSLTFFLFFFVFLSFHMAYADTVKRYIVSYKEESLPHHLRGLSKSALGAHGSHGEFQILELTQSEAYELSVDERVHYIEEDRLLQHMGVGLMPIEDQRYFEQWALHSEDGGIFAPEAWDISIGSEEIVVAVLDTGITPHPDLDERVLPGATTISDLSISNNGKTRHNSALDPGDWVEFGDMCYRGFFTSSSWHGTHVAGTIGAVAGNGIGIAGVDWKARILPVRVLGKCGGRISDIADGIRWAAGISVAGLEDNPHPARVINLSLGGEGPCGNTMQQAINQARAKGAVVVVASGNSGANLNFQQFSPANCQGVLTVAAGDRFGQVTSYSNLGNAVDIVAPGGTQGSSGGVISTLNMGERSPSMASYAYYNGTSMAAPHVSGVASLILGLRPELSVNQVVSIIKQSAQMINDYSCQMGACGSGLVNAEEALRLALEMGQDDDPSDGSNPLPPPGDGGGAIGDAPIGGDERLLTHQTSSGGCGLLREASFAPDPYQSSKQRVLFALFLAIGLLATSRDVIFFKKNKN